MDGTKCHPPTTENGRWGHRSCPAGRPSSSSRVASVGRGGAADRGTGPPRSSIGQPRPDRPARAIAARGGQGSRLAHGTIIDNAAELRAGFQRSLFSPQLRGASRLGIGVRDKTKMRPGCLPLPARCSFGAGPSPCRAVEARSPRGPARSGCLATHPAFRRCRGVAGLLQGQGRWCWMRGRRVLWAHIPSAQAVDWLDFSRWLGASRSAASHPTGHGEQTLGPGRRCGAAGAAVYGAAAAEKASKKGRIAWLLLYLGHPQVCILDEAFPGSGRARRRGGPGAAAGHPGCGTATQPGLRADKARCSARCRHRRRTHPVW